MSWKAKEGLTTKQLADWLDVKVRSLLVVKAQNKGTYRGLVPKRLRNGHLRWPPNSRALIARREAYLADHPRKNMRREEDEY